MKDSFLQKLEHDLADGFLNQKEFDRIKTGYLNCNDQRDILAKELETGAIDRDKYTTRYQEITLKYRTLEEQRDKIIKKNTNKAAKRKRTLIIIVLIIILVGVSAYLVWNYQYSHRSIANIPEPIQIDYTGEKSSEIHVVHGADIGRPDYEMKMSYLAEYDIKGLVTGTKHMPDETAYDKSFPVDVGMAWGVYAANRNVMECTNGPRKLSCTYQNSDLERIGANRTILNKVSNNHLSPSSKEIYDKIKKIRAGDYIEIKGYLVHVNVKSDGDSFQATSSTSRTDRMDGAFDHTNTGCEMIYVTSIEWLD